MIGLIMFTIFLVPKAQAIWGHEVFGYKTAFHCLNSLIMLNYSKGSFDQLLYQKTSQWTVIFVVIYFLFLTLSMHSVFHYLQ